MRTLAILRNVACLRWYGHGEQEAESAADVEAEDGDAAARGEEQNENDGNRRKLQGCDMGKMHSMSVG